MKRGTCRENSSGTLLELCFSSNSIPLLDSKTFHHRCFSDDYIVVKTSMDKYAIFWKSPTSSRRSSSHSYIAETIHASNFADSFIFRLGRIPLWRLWEHHTSIENEGNNRETDNPKHCGMLRRKTVDCSGWQSVLDKLSEKEQELGLAHQPILCQRRYPREVYTTWEQQSVRNSFSVLCCCYRHTFSSRKKRLSKSVQDNITYYKSHDGHNDALTGSVMYKLS